MASQVACCRDEKDRRCCFLGVSKRLCEFASNDGLRELGENGGKTWGEQREVCAGSEFVMHARHCVSTGSIGPEELSSCCH